MSRETNLLLLGVPISGNGGGGDFPGKWFVITVLLLLWTSFVGAWAWLSYYEWHVHHDAGCFVGGGVVMVPFTIIGLAITVMIWKFDD
jgi:hypothetical protein